MKKFLVITRKMLELARGNKCCGLIFIHPKDFLYLTTNSSAALDEIQNSAKTLDEYNKWATSGSSQIPTIKVSFDTVRFGSPVKIGQIQEHEGRHRAQALLTEGGTSMIVAVQAAFGGYSRYKFEEGEKYTPSFKVRYLGASDMPKRLYGEFAPSRSVDIDTHKFKPLFT